MDIRKNNYDLIRLVAALQVVMHHMIEHLNIHIDHASYSYTLFKAFPGVPIFFFISGFVISLAYESSNGMQFFVL